jgi:hypothetical protein
VQIEGGFQPVCQLGADIAGSAAASCFRARQTFQLDDLILRVDVDWLQLLGSEGHEVAAAVFASFADLSRYRSPRRFRDRGAERDPGRGRAQVSPSGQVDRCFAGRLSGAACLQYAGSSSPVRWFAVSAGSHWLPVGTTTPSWARLVGDPA